MLSKSQDAKSINIKTIKDKFDDDFFKDFKISLGNETYFFSPWNDEQRRFIGIYLNSLKELIIKFDSDQKDKKIKRKPNFPYYDFKERLEYIIKIFFNVSNLSINFNKDIRLVELMEEESRNKQNPEAKRKEFLKHMGSIKFSKNNEEFMKSYENLADTISKPRSKEKLEEIVGFEEKEKKQEIHNKIVKFVFNKFFPNMKENIKNNKKVVIIKQIQTFIRTIDNSFNQVI